MTEAESIRDAESAYEYREAVYRIERDDSYPELDALFAPRRADSYTLELLAEAERIRARRLAEDLDRVFTFRKKQVA